MNTRRFTQVRQLVFWLALLIALLFASIASAQMRDADRVQPTLHSNLPGALIQQTKLIADDGTADDQFGYAVALSSDGSIAVIGAPYQGFIGGAAYIFVHSGGTWIQQQKLMGGAQSVTFGFAVAISSDGNTIAIADPSFRLDDTYQPGAVIVFTRSAGTWTQQQMLRAAGKTGNISFGYRVGMSNDGSTIVVGANWEQVTLPGQGAAYVFTKSGPTWNQQARLLASDGKEQDHFGEVAINGDGSRAVVGAGSADLISVNDDRGSAYVFDRPIGGWLTNTLTESAKLTASDGAAVDWFGGSVSLSSDGNMLAIGSNGNHNGTEYVQGAVYTFVRSSGVWNQQQKLLAADRGTQNAEFGVTVALSADGNRLAVGAPYVSTGVIWWHGAAYAFARSAGTFSQQQRMVASDKGFDDNAGHVTISGDGNTIILGSRKDDIGSHDDQGSAYIFVVGKNVYLPLILK
jgi:hypothetical protein